MNHHLRNFLIFSALAMGASFMGLTRGEAKPPGTDTISQEPAPTVELLEPELYAPTETAMRPERRVADIYPDCASEEVLQLKHVKALKFDLPLVRRDFSFMADWSQARIFSWFEKMAGVVSTAQAAQSSVNTPIETTGVKMRAYRPPGYGRALVVEFEEDGFKGAFEVKMSGVAPGRHPHHGPHGNGIGTLGEVIREDQFENAERAALAHALKTGLIDAQVVGGTVAGYGFMYAGYDVRHADGSTSPAGIYVRQAHRRLSYTDDVRAAWLPAEAKREILKQLSRYGFYTGWESNIQGLVKNGRTYVFDFGHWIAWQGYVSESGIWVDPRLALDFKTWGWPGWLGPDRAHDQWRTSKLDQPWLWAHQVANSLWQREAQNYIVAHYNNMLVPYFLKLGVGVPKAPVAARASSALSKNLTCANSVSQNFSWPQFDASLRQVF